MAFHVKACTEFSAAHRIEGHPRCGRIHGHNYRVCVTVAEQEPLEVDLDELEEWLHREVYMVLDHQYLNEVLSKTTRDLPRVTAEELAEVIAAKLSERFGERVVAIEVCETRNLCIEYKPPRRG